MIFRGLCFAAFIAGSLFWGSNRAMAQSLGAQSQSIDGNSITAHLSISRRYVAFADSNVTISQLLADTLTDSIYFFSEDIEYDKNVVEFIDVANGARTPSPDWAITKTATTPGVVHVSAVSSGGALNGPGEILRLIFHVLDTARLFQTADFSGSNAVLGTPLETNVLSDTGQLHIIDVCTPILVEDGAPLTLSAQCTPNPASGGVIIHYDVPIDARQERHIRLLLYDLAGNLARQLLDADESAGRHELVFDVSELPSGAYFYECSDGNSRQLRMLRVSH